MTSARARAGVRGLVAAFVALALLHACLTHVRGIQASAERVGVEAMIARLRTAAAFAEAKTRITGKDAYLPESGNPVLLLDVLPWNYAGEVPEATQRNTTRGRWVYERSSRSLLYRPRHADGWCRGTRKTCRVRLVLQVRGRGRHGSASHDAFSRAEPTLRLEVVEPEGWDRRQTRAPDETGSRKEGT